MIKFADRCFELIHMPSSSSYIPSVLPLIFLISKIVAGVGMPCISSAILLPVIFACNIWGPVQFHLIVHSSNLINVKMTLATTA